ncbi:phage tail protein [Paenibacillus sp. NEAU-GSW1]|uniref:phage tail protein n=1 Tax=Paenibacillus sp. NEAU-GSW1 TaxID=2682486 RepID=UPI0012E21EAE|nr:tail fiber protein [Paenibacillus sp. NEAU-GSW1]MUT67222.1 phage tail protein [Paenibacillus sp. NEAU-GSW1]
MSTPFLSEIRMFSFNFAPRNWALCDGQLLPINQNQALFSLLGTTFGGNGQTNFALPDLRGRVPIGVGDGYTLGEQGGQEAHTLSISEMPAHNHPLLAKSIDATTTLPKNGVWAAPAVSAYHTGGPGGVGMAMKSGTIGSIGGSQPHWNMQPYLTMNFCIALTGIFPSPD